MKKILIIIFLFVALQLNASTYYCAPTTATPAGNDANAGIISAPFFTLNQAWTVLAAGDTLYLRGGTYSFLTQQRLRYVNGTVTDTVCVFAYPGETPILTKDASFTPYTSWPKSLIWSQGGDYIYWKGFTIAYYTQETTDIWYAMVVYDAEHNKVERINSHHNGHGFLFTYRCDNNLVLNCDFHHNYDPLTDPVPYDNADGLEFATNIADTCENTIRGCRFWHNSDDGLDLWDNDGNVIVDSCWAWMNGYEEDEGTSTLGNGIKLGKSENADGSSFRRIVTNCISFMNVLDGIGQNAANIRMYIYNNTVWNNGLHGFDFWWYDLANIFRNNISFGNYNENYFGVHTNATIDHNSYDDSWQPTGPVVTSSDFITLDTTGVSGSRKADGSLPDIDFLRLKKGSVLIDAGVDVGIPYRDVAPDLGAFEWAPRSLFGKYQGSFSRVNGKYIIINQ